MINNPKVTEVTEVTEVTHIYRIGARHTHMRAYGPNGAKRHFRHFCHSPAGHYNGWPFTLSAKDTRND